MAVTILGTVLIVLFAIIGYLRGVLRLLAAFVAFVVAGLVARPLSIHLVPLFPDGGLVPRTLVPLSAMIAAGLLVFGVLSIAATLAVARRERARKKRDLPVRSVSERLLGFAFGGLWGLLLLVLVLTGIEVIADVDSSLKKAAARGSGSDGSATGGVTPVAESSELSAYVSRLQQDVGDSVFGPLVERVNPVDERVLEPLERIAVVISDPELFERFRLHPDVVPFTKHPKLVALASDPVIAEAVRSGDLHSLLDNPDLAAVLEDTELRRELSRLDIRGVLDEVFADTWLQQP